MTLKNLKRQTIAGPSGALEVAFITPDHPRGVALIAPPNPQAGGTMDNKIVTTLAKAFYLAGLTAVRFNYRGIGNSQGSWDNGKGETDDALAVLYYFLSGTGLAKPLVALAGFSFGCAVQSQLLARIAPPDAMVLIAPPPGRFPVAPVPPHTLVVHGDEDELIPYSDVLAWARPQKLPITIFPNCGHFFHGRLLQLQHVVADHLKARL